LRVLSQVLFAALSRSHSRALRCVFSRAALPRCALLYMRYTFYMLEMEARWFRPLRASLSAMHTTSRPQCLFLFLTRIFSFRFVSFSFFFKVVAHLSSICGEASTWNTKKKVIDAFKASIMWDRSLSY